MRPRFFALAGALALGACISLFPESGAPPQVYRLSEPEPGLATRIALPWTVEVAPTAAARALAGNRVAVSPDGLELAYAAGARWQSPTPRLIQDLMVDAFGADGRVLAAVRPEDGVRASCELRLHLDNFEAVYADGEGVPPDAVMSVRAMLVEPSTRRLAAASEFAARERADEDRMRAIIAALDAVAQDVARDVVAWTIEQGGAPGDEDAVCAPLSDTPDLRGGDQEG